MIEVNQVTKTFKAGESEVRAVDNASFDVNPGDFVLIFGRSGSGKSTLLGMLAGLIRPTSGLIRIKGRDIGSLSDNQISELRATELGFVFQFSGLLPTVSVLENVMLPTLFCKDGSDSRSRAAELIRKVGLFGRVNAYPRTLSSGEMKRVAIARALMNDPSLLIADEPTGDLDAETEYEIMELFKKLNQEGMTIVMVTHNPDLVSYGTQTYMMESGKLSERDRSSLPGVRSSESQPKPDDQL